MAKVLRLRTNLESSALVPAFHPDDVARWKEQRRLWRQENANLHLHQDQSKVSVVPTHPKEHEQQLSKRQARLDEEPFCSENHKRILQSKEPEWNKKIMKSFLRIWLYSVLEKKNMDLKEWRAYMMCRRAWASGALDNINSSLDANRLERLENIGIKASDLDDEVWFPGAFDPPSSETAKLPLEERKERLIRKLVVAIRREKEKEEEARREQEEERRRLEEEEEERRKLEEEEEEEEEAEANDEDEVEDSPSKDDQRNEEGEPHLDLQHHSHNAHASDHVPTTAAISSHNYGHPSVLPQSSHTGAASVHAPKASELPSELDFAESHATEHGAPTATSSSGNQCDTSVTVENSIGAVCDTETQAEVTIQQPAFTEQTEPTYAVDVGVSGPVHPEQTNEQQPALTEQPEPTSAVNVGVSGPIHPGQTNEQQPALTEQTEPTYAVDVGVSGPAHPEQTNEQRFHGYQDLLSAYAPVGMSLDALNEIYARAFAQVVTLENAEFDLANGDSELLTTGRCSEHVGWVRGADSALNAIPVAPEPVAVDLSETFNRDVCMNRELEIWNEVYSRAFVQVLKDENAQVADVDGEDGREDQVLPIHKNTFPECIPMDISIRLDEEDMMDDTPDDCSVEMSILQGLCDLQAERMVIDGEDEDGDVAMSPIETIVPPVLPVPPFLPAPSNPSMFPMPLAPSNPSAFPFPIVPSNSPAFPVSFVSANPSALLDPSIPSVLPAPIVPSIPSVFPAPIISSVSSIPRIFLVEDTIMELGRISIDKSMDSDVESEDIESEDYDSFDNSGWDSRWDFFNGT